LNPDPDVKERSRRYENEMSSNNEADRRPVSILLADDNTMPKIMRCGIIPL
jgi:hypothetical protein